MIGGSHYQLRTVGYGQQAEGVGSTLGLRFFTALSDGCLRDVEIDDAGNDVTLSKQFRVVCRACARDTYTPRVGRRNHAYGHESSVFGVLFHRPVHLLGRVIRTILEYLGLYRRF